MNRKKTKPSDILDQAPPSDVKAEMGVIGSILLEPSVRKDVSFLTPADFYVHAHTILFGELMRMGPVDSVLVPDHLRTVGKLKEIGGTAYLHEIGIAVPVAAHAVHYARIVKDMSIKRAMLRLNLKVIQSLYSLEGKAKQMAERQILRLQEIIGE